jgi:predicted anti-sigma-YlaC factor YlaD
MSSDELGCRDLTEAITDYLEGAMAPADAARLEEHLRECGACRTYLDQMGRTIELTGRPPQDPIPAALRERLLDVFTAWRASGGAAGG